MKGSKLRATNPKDRLLSAVSVRNGKADLVVRSHSSAQVASSGSVDEFPLSPFCSFEKAEKHLSGRAGPFNCVADPCAG